MIGTRGKSDVAEQSIRVEIYNQTYNIRSDGDNEYIMRLAEYVDSKMREISSGTAKPPAEVVPMDTSLCSRALLSSSFCAATAL